MFILRRMHKVQYANAVSVSQSHVLSKPFRSSTGNADDIATLNLRLDPRDLVPGNMADSSGSHRLFHVTDHGDQAGIVPQIAGAPPIPAHLIKITAAHGY